MYMRVLWNVYMFGCVGLCECFCVGMGPKQHNGASPMICT